MYLNKKKVFTFILSLTLILSAFFPYFSPTVHAEDSSGFHVKAIIPKNQIDRSLAYFDLKMKTSQEQTLEVLVTNDTSKPMTVSVAAISASTNSNGIIDYITPNIKDETLKYPFSEMATVVTPKVKIAAFASQKIKVKVKMPSQLYDGVVLGGIKIVKEISKSEASQEGTQVVNQFSSVVGVKLSETNKVIKPDYELVKVTAGVVDFYPAVVVSIRNFEAAIAKEITVDLTIYRNSKTKANRVATVHKENLEMAPNSVMPLAIYFTNGELVAGDYIAVISWKDDGKEWTFESPFKVTAEDQKNIEDNSVVKYPSDTTPWILYGAIVVLLLLIFILFFLLWKRRKDDEEEEEEEHVNQSKDNEDS